MRERKIISGVVQQLERSQSAPLEEALSFWVSHVGDAKAASEA